MNHTNHFASSFHSVVFSRIIRLILPLNHRVPQQRYSDSWFIFLPFSVQYSYGFTLPIAGDQTAQNLTFFAKSAELRQTWLKAVGDAMWVFYGHLHVCGRFYVRACVWDRRPPLHKHPIGGVLSRTSMWLVEKFRFLLRASDGDLTGIMTVRRNFNVPQYFSIFCDYFPLQFAYFFGKRNGQLVFSSLPCNPTVLARVAL